MTDKPFALVIFDCDGVLVDSEVITKRVFASMLNELGVAISDLKVVPGIVEALDTIRTPYCVASNASHEKMQITLGVTGLPFPDIFLYAARRLIDAGADGTFDRMRALPGLISNRRGGQVCSKQY